MVRKIKYRQWRDRVVKHIQEYGPTTTDILHSEIKMKRAHPPSVMSAGQVLALDKRLVNMGRICSGHFRTTYHYAVSTWGLVNEE
jgi:hypothetical protein